jgi:hypothetical protein
MRNSKLVNVLAIVGALIVILGVGSAANRAFAAPLDAGLISNVTTTS